MKQFLGTQKTLDFKLYEYLTEPRFSVKDLKDISSRMINYWHTKGFLFITDRDVNNREWRKFSFTDYIWIRMLKEMSEMGISVNEVVPDILKYLAISHPDLERKVEHTQTANIHSYIKEVMSKDEISESFTYMLMVVVSYKNPLTIRIYSDKVVREVWGNPDYLGMKFLWLKKDKENVDLNFDSYISISVGKHILDFIENASLNNISALNILSKPEMDVLQHMRNKEIKKISIRFDKGKPVMFEITDSVNKTDISKRLYEYLIMPYQDITFKTFDGKTTSFERTVFEKIIDSE